MPKYRQLHTKIVDSFDFSEMPDDFTRVIWLLLIVVVDSEGRGIDNPAWIRSKMFPLRPDVDLSAIQKSMDWLYSRRMIERYQSGDRVYFQIPTFRSYQSGTDKEAKSVLPGPKPLQTYSEPTPEQVRVNADTKTDTKTDTKAESDDETYFSANPLSKAFEVESHIQAPGTDPRKWIAACDKMLELGITPDDVRQATYQLIQKGYTVVGPSSVVNAAINIMTRRLQNGSATPSGTTKLFEAGPDGRVNL